MPSISVKTTWVMLTRWLLRCRSWVAAFPRAAPHGRTQVRCRPLGDRLPALVRLSMKWVPGTIAPLADVAAQRTGVSPVLLAAGASHGGGALYVPSPFQASSGTAAGWEDAGPGLPL